jgi:hypothetical protein
MRVLANIDILKLQHSAPYVKQGCEDIKHLLFTCMRAKQVWRALGLWSYIKDQCRVDHSGSVILEEILTSPSKQSPVVGLLGMKKTILVAGWYIWWKRCETVKGESVANAKNSAFSIHAITTNYGAATKAIAPKVDGWIKPPPKTYKLNVDASFFHRE